MNIAYCDGGLGNRFASLLVAYVTQKKYGTAWIIAWPTNNWCGASFDKLFDSDFQWNDTEITSYKRFPDDYRFVIHENPSGAIIGEICDQKNLRSYDDLDLILNAGKHVFYTANLLPAFVSAPDFMGLDVLIRPSDKVLGRVTEFLKNQSIDHHVKGLHLRKTDFRSNLNVDDLFAEVASTPSQRYFVCTDSKEIQDKFASLSNCVSYEKTDYPQKLKPDLDWNGTITDNAGRHFPFNINRNEKAVLEGWADLLILSMTDIIQTSNSTFLNLARILKDINYVRRCCV